jgi:fumarate reductase subunit C
MRPSEPQAGLGADALAPPPLAPLNVRLYLMQRVSAAVMVPLVAVHLGVMFYASARGLSAAEILGRTQGSIGWALFYGIFVLAAAVHAAIGVRGVLSEWTPLGRLTRDLVASGLGLALAGFGLRAVAAVTLP